MSKYKIIMIETFDLMPNCNKIRHSIDENALETLVDSIKNCGVLQPLIVRKRKIDKAIYINGECIKSPKYEIISGERRWRSAKILKLKKLPCIVVKANDEASALLSLNENLQREPIKFFELANYYNVFLEKYCIEIDDLSNLIGVSKKNILAKLNLLKLTNEEVKVIDSYKLSEDHARELVRINDVDIRKKLLTKIAASSLNIFETEELIDAQLNPDHHEVKIKEAERRSSIFKISDIRFFYNSLERALSILKHAGVSFEQKKVEYGDIIDITIRINKYKNINLDW